MTMQFNDLGAQMARIRPQVDAGIARVLDHGKFILGPEVAELEEHLAAFVRSEEHTSELQSLMRSSYAVFCLKKKNTTHHDANQCVTVVTDITFDDNHILFAYLVLLYTSMVPNTLY